MKSRIPVILIYDIGKTNKKIILFDKTYNVVFEKSRQFQEVPDKDGFPSEDIRELTVWIKSAFHELVLDSRFDIKAINFSGYGASFVLLDRSVKLISPLYNYLKTYPKDLEHSFYSKYGGEEIFSRVTSSPVLGSLNSGLQLYRIKHEDPDLFKEIKYAIHLPQYLSFILSGSIHSDITSIGCHTGLWNFEKNQYHEWVVHEGIDQILPPIVSSDGIAGYVKNHSDQNIPVGIGLHDSSAALIPYQKSINHPFVLLSTGTWSITMNPFNQSILTQSELQQDCLCYLSYTGKQIKSSRLFAGHLHDEMTKELVKHFSVESDAYKRISLKEDYTEQSFEHAYIQMIKKLIKQQVESTDLVMTKEIRDIFVDGGFTKNLVFMKLLAESYAEKNVYAAEVAQASSLGAALIMHPFWNEKSFETDKLVKIQRI